MNPEKKTDGFFLDGFWHSRVVDSVLEDLSVEVSRYLGNIAGREVELIDLFLPEEPEKFFWLVDLREMPSRGFWEIHFKTFRDNTNPNSPPWSVLEESQKQRLFRAVSEIIPRGEKLGTSGTITPGGLRGMKRFGDLGFEECGKTSPRDYRSGEEVLVPVWKKL